MPLHEWKLSVRGERRNASFIRAAGKYIRIPGMVSLGGGLPHPSLNDLKLMKLSLGDAPEVSISSKQVTFATAYVPTLGMDPLRDWILHYLHREHSYPHSENFEFVVGNGSQDLLQRLFDIILDPEDTILVEEYTYSGALAALWPVGCHIQPVTMDDKEGIDPEALEDLLLHWDPKKRMPKALYVIPVANNPTGVSLSNARKRAIYALAQKFNFVIIEDDPYWNLNFTQTDVEGKRTSFWSLDVDQRVVRLESLSKITAVGYRVGWASGPRGVIEKLAFDLEAGAQSGSGVSQLVVHELVSRLLNTTSSDGWDAHVNKIRDTYLQRWKIMEAALKEHLTGLAEWSSPAGGMFAWVKLHGMPDTKEFVKNLAENHLVLTVPGSAFCPDSTTDSPYIRLSYSFCDIELIAPAVEVIGKALRQWASK